MTTNPFEGFATLLASSVKGREDKPTIRPVLMAQEMELLDRYRRFHCNPHILAPGDRVREQAGIGLMKPEYRKNHLLIIWRLLDMGNSFDAKIALDFAGRYHTDRLDCLVAFLTDSGASLQFEPRALAQLEPWDGEDEPASIDLEDGQTEAADRADPESTHVGG